MRKNREESGRQRKFLQGQSEAVSLVLSAKIFLYRENKEKVFSLAEKQ